MERSDTPYQDFGNELSRIRRRAQESVSEVSGAVEIDTDKFEQYELGKKRPSEDILDLLISHFEIKEKEATKLWKLAGYDEEKPAASQDEPNVMPQQIMLLPFDARVIYTDVMHITINNNGVVLNFMQNIGGNNQQMPAARVGMSLEHAKLVSKSLEETIRKAEQKSAPKYLPSPKNNKKPNDNK